ncbi:hypothetical protein [Rasiella sp. SM2506]|uniref:hypothetical protein n=1 Tax=Rasiella sp. SM2506 TaxID=3423914 RepID=UPI003D7AC789
MKNPIYLICLATLFLAACSSNDDTLNEEEEVTLATEKIYLHRWIDFNSDLRINVQFDQLDLSTNTIDSTQMGVLGYDQYGTAGYSSSRNILGYSTYKQGGGIAEPEISTRQWVDLDNETSYDFDPTNNRFMTTSENYGFFTNVPFIPASNFPLIDRFKIFRVNFETSEQDIVFNYENELHAYNLNKSFYKEETNQLFSISKDENDNHIYSKFDLSTNQFQIYSLENLYQNIVYTPNGDLYATEKNGNTISALVQLNPNTGEVINEIATLNYQGKSSLEHIVASNKLILLHNNDSWEYDFERIVTIDLSSGERSQIDLPHSYIELIVDNIL